MTKTFWLLCFFTAFATAQTRELELHFQTDSFELTASESHKLDQFIQSFDDRQNLTMAIAGHTDNVGDLAYNAVLSDKRAQTIASVFGRNGFDERNIVTSGRGEVHPVASNDTDAGKAKNRRVIVKVSKPEKTVAKTIDNRSLPETGNSTTIGNGKVNHIGGFKRGMTTFTIDAENPEVLTYPSGTKITIPKSAFVDKDGRTVTGRVELKYIEYRDPIDFILSNIAMDHGGGTFHSGGMFKILAYQNGQQVHLGKGQEIDFEFPITDNVPDMNFYRYDSISRQWTELPRPKPLDSAPKIFTVSRIDLVDANNLNYPCSLDPCLSLGYIRQKGMKLAEMERSVYQYYLDYQKKRDSTLVRDRKEDEPVWVDTGTHAGYMKPKQAIVVFERVVKARSRRLAKLPGYIERLTPSFSVSKLAPADGKPRFIVNYKAPNNIKIPEFASTEWTAEDAALPEYLFTKKWDSCTISILGNDRYKIVLKDSTETLALSPLGMKNQNLQGNSKEKFIAGLNMAVGIQKKKIQRLTDTKIQAEKELADAREKIELLKQGKYTDSYVKNLDEMECFWKMNRTYMSAKEISMSTDAWFQYFDKNKKQMAERYTELTISRECAERARLQQQAVQMRNNAKALTQSLKISDLGIYNCDQIARLQQPVIVDVTYRDQEGKKVRPTFIYLVDSRINGILRYDGSFDYSPFHFAYSPKSENTLLAFAGNDSYIVSAEEFRKTMESGQGYITLRKVEKIETKEDLAAQF
ncbi:hypothetical protein FLLO111716_13285 [Flavobacterium longum]|uniref:OmpA family protein n=1 Tax=Flavobacterium longum TaxID=1299340 RepID=UPI0039E7E702